MGGTIYVRALGNIADVHGKQGEFGDLVNAIFGSEMMLAHRPKPLVGRISGGGGVGDWLGKCDQRGTLEMCEMALLRVVPWEGILEAMVAIRRHRDIEMEGWNVRGRWTANT